MGNFYEDNDDLRFYVERYIDWDELVRLTEYEWRSEGGFETVEEAREFYVDLLNLVGSFTADEIAPLAAEIDREKPKLVDGEVVYGPNQQAVIDGLRDLEIHGMCLPRELGGMACPFLVFSMNTEIIGRADVSVTAHHGFHGGMAMAMLMYSVTEGTTQFDRDTAQIVETRFGDGIAQIIGGEEFGSMDITEPGAGSDMARLICKGEQDADGNWFVTGQKIFITSGHGRYHFVIARTEKASGDDAFSGLEGLSMFMVPAFERDADGKIVRTTTTLDTLEDKLGHTGSATIAISFDRSPAHLIGERGEGFKHMLLLMNNARVGVGFECLGLCEAAYRMAKAYAAERPSMGKTIDKHEMIADYLEQMKTDIQAIRSMCVYAGWREEMRQKIELKLRFWPPEDADERNRLERLVKRYKAETRHVTPLLKYYASEKAVEMARMNLQIHGGSGYMREYGAEKLLRDAMVMPIYEGTSQIQALMAMKDSLLGVIKNPRRFVRETARARWLGVSGSGDERRVAKLQQIQNASIQFLLSRLGVNKFREIRHLPLAEWATAMKDFDPKRDFALAMLHAERLLKILTDVAVAEILLEQAAAYPERQDVLDRWLERAEPRCRYWHDEITTTGLRLLRTLREDEDEAPVAEQAAK